jgi:hypothetical protein
MKSVAGLIAGVVLGIVSSAVSQSLYEAHDKGPFFMRAGGFDSDGKGHPLVVNADGSVNCRLLKLVK